MLFLLEFMLFRNSELKLWRKRSAEETTRSIMRTRWMRRLFATRRSARCVSWIPAQICQVGILLVLDTPFLFFKSNVLWAHRSGGGGGWEKAYCGIRSEIFENLIWAWKSKILILGHLKIEKFQDELGIQNVQFFEIQNCGAHINNQTDDGERIRFQILYFENSNRTI